MWPAYRASYSQENKPQVEGNHKAVAPMDSPHEPPADGFQGDKLVQVVLGYGDVRNLPGNLRSLADGDARVRR